MLVEAGSTLKQHWPGVCYVSIDCAHVFSDWNAIRWRAIDSLIRDLIGFSFQSETQSAANAITDAISSITLAKYQPFSRQSLLYIFLFIYLHFSLIINFLFFLAH